MAHSKYELQRYKVWRAETISKMGGKCVECGSEEELEFDHINPTEKEFSISTRWSVMDVALEEELAKCQLLCHDCHLTKTKGERGVRSGVV